MNYHMIRTDDMLNGAGLRVILFVSGCSHHCRGCHNPETWDSNSGFLFNQTSAETIFNELNKDYISGITLSGGDPLFESNRKDILELISYIKKQYPTKDIWLYTGYTWDEIINDNLMFEILQLCDVIVEGKFNSELMDVNYPYAGSTNQRVIDVQQSLKNHNIVLLDDLKEVE